MSIDKLIAYKNETLEMADANNIVDINNIRIDSSESKNNRIIKYMEDVQNPYIYKVDDIIVRVNFNSNGKSFEDAIIDYYNAAV